MFTEYRAIQFILHCLMEKIKQRSVQTAARAVSFGNEQYHSANCLQSSLQLTTPIITLTHITIYYCHN